MRKNKHNLHKNIIIFNSSKYCPVNTENLKNIISNEVNKSFSVKRCYLHKIAFDIRAEHLTVFFRIAYRPGLRIEFSRYFPVLTHLPESRVTRVQLDSARSQSSAAHSLHIYEKTFVYILGIVSAIPRFNLFRIHILLLTCFTIK